MPGQLLWGILMSAAAPARIVRPPCDIAVLTEIPGYIPCLDQQTERFVVDEAWRLAAIAYRRPNRAPREDPADPLLPYLRWLKDSAHRQEHDRAWQETNAARRFLRRNSLRDLVERPIETLIEADSRYHDTKSTKRSQVKSVLRRQVRNLLVWFDAKCIIVLPTDGIVVFEESPCP